MSDTSRAERPPTLDPVASARWANWPHLQSPWLNEEIGRRMEDRLQWIRLQPTSWIDWAPVSGGLNTHAQLRARYPQADCHVVEVSPARQCMARQTLQAPWWKRWMHPSRVTFGAPTTSAADMLWANMALHTSDNPQALLQQWHQLLAVDGFLMFSCLGPDTLRELAEETGIAAAPDFTEELMWKGFSPEIRQQIETTGVWLRPSEYGDPYPITKNLIEEGPRARAD